MKKVIYYLAAMAVFFTATTLLSGCAKDGDTGPAGATGAAGTNGTNGTNGNANVQLFMFPAHTFTSAATTHTVNLPSPVTANMIDSSLILVYHERNGNWYQSPGLGYSGQYDLRSYIIGLNVAFQMYNPDGTAYSGLDQNFTQIKVIVVPVNGYTGSRPAVDYSDYYATMQYFNLPY
jgi:hypothetical protein